jgi:hypothetical protein
MAAAKTGGISAKQLQKYAPLILGGLLVLLALYMYSASPASATQQGYATVPDPNAGTPAGGSAPQSSAYSTAALQAATQLASTQYQVQAQQAAAATAAQLTQFQTAEQANVSITQANDQLASAQATAHASQQNAFWGGLFGAVSKIPLSTQQKPGVAPTLTNGGGSGGTISYIAQPVTSYTGPVITDPGGSYDY